MSRFIRRHEVGWRASSGDSAGMWLVFALLPGTIRIIKVTPKQSFSG